MAEQREKILELCKNSAHGSQSKNLNSSPEKLIILKRHSLKFIAHLPNKAF